MKCFTRTLFLSPALILAGCNDIPHNDAHAIYPAAEVESPMVIDDSIIDRAQMDALSDIQHVGILLTCPIGHYNM